MPGIPIVSKTGPKTYTPASGEAIRGGLLIEARTGARVGVAGAGSLHVLGVATNDAQAPEQLQTSPSTDSSGRYVLPAAQFPTSVSVVYGGAEVPVTYAADAAFGDLLVAAANGTVTPFTGFSATATNPNVDDRLIVGRCTEPAGVTVATNAVGLMRTAL